MIILYIYIHIFNIYQLIYYDIDILSSLYMYVYIYMVYIYIHIYIE